MRGTIQSYDCHRGTGVVRARDGRTFQFSNAHVVRRSKKPRLEANVAFRLSGGKVSKLVVVSYKRQWTWLAQIFEALLYLPLALKG